MYIYLSDSIILMAVFVCGLIIGAAIYRLIARPQDALDTARIEVMSEMISGFENRKYQESPKPNYDGHDRNGYQPNIKQSKPSNPPMPIYENAPPKPLHNPHK